MPVKEKTTFDRLLKGLCQQWAEGLGRLASEPTAAAKLDVTECLVDITSSMCDLLLDNERHWYDKKWMDKSPPRDCDSDWIMGLMADMEDTPGPSYARFQKRFSLDIKFVHFARVMERLMKAQQKTDAEPVNSEPFPSS